jgi:proteic killer suppression protein
MQVLFATGKLMRELAQPGYRLRRFGARGAARIDLRLQQLFAAPTLADARHLPGRCHALSGDLKGHLAIDVLQPYRLIFRPTANPVPLDNAGGLDWAAIDSITITDIIDYH